MAKKTYNVRMYGDIRLARLNDTTVIGYWKFNCGTTTKDFTVWWEYWSYSYGKSGGWVIGQIKSVPTNQHDQGWFHDTWSPPDYDLDNGDATHVRLWVRPNSKTHQVTTGSGKNKKTKTEEYWYSRSRVSNAPAYINNPKMDAEVRRRYEPADPPRFTATLEPNGTVRVRAEAPDDITAMFAVYREMRGGGKWGPDDREYGCVCPQNGFDFDFIDASAKRGELYRYALTSKRLWKGKVSSEGNLSAAVEVEMPPAAPTGLTARASGLNAARLDWNDPSGTGERYEVQWSEHADAWDEGRTDITTVTPSGTARAKGARHCTVTGLPGTGTVWFRVRTVGGGGESDLSNIASTALGTVPGAPTPQTSAPSAVLDSALVLRWAHNSEDASAQTAFEVELELDGAKSSVKGGADQLLEVVPAELGAGDGSSLTWRVRTWGAVADPGPWSRSQTVALWARPAAEVGFPAVVTGFPVALSLSCGHSDGNPAIEWWADVRAASGYEAVGADGRAVRVEEGDVLWSGEASGEGVSDGASWELSAQDVRLQEGASYTVSGGCVTAQGLRGDAEPVTATVLFDGDAPPEPSADAEFDPVTLTCSVWPECYEDGDPDDEPVVHEGVTMAVWRVGADGGTVLVGSGVQSGSGAQVVDPHPAFGACGYRIVATDDETGMQSFADVSADTPCGDLVVQWDESWAGEFDRLEYTGKRLALRYGAEAVERYDPDVAVTEHAGAAHPRAKYGTQRRQTQAWQAMLKRGAEAEKYALLRELAGPVGDVYVREPSGTGFWAFLHVTDLGHDFARSGLDTVSIEVTRVEHGEGGFDGLGV